MKIKPDAIKALNYLKKIRPTGYINVCAKDTKSDIMRGIVATASDPKLLEFITKYIKDHNMYYGPNEPLFRDQKGHVTSQDIQTIHAFYIDLDPDKSKPYEEEKARLIKQAEQLKHHKSPPNIIIDSGGGIQCLWMLKTPFPANKINAEGYGKALKNEHGGDAVHDRARLLRLPFTTNFPNEAKRASGRNDETSHVLHFDDDFYPSPGVITEPVSSEQLDADYKDVRLDLSQIPTSLDDAPQLMARLKTICDYDDDFNDLMHERKTLSASTRNDQSTIDFTLAKKFKQHDLTLEDYATYVRNRERPKGKKVPTGRDVIRTFHRAEDPYDGLSLPQNYLDQLAKQVNPNSSLSAMADTIDDDDDLEFFSELNHENSADYIVNELIMEASFNVVFGPSGSGKSFLTTDLVSHIALGKDWSDFKIREQRPVIYVCAEAGNSYGKRAEAVRMKLGISDSIPHADFPIAASKKPIDLTDKKAIAKLVKKVKKMKRITNREKGVCVIDTLATAFGGGNENNSQDMNTVINNLKEFIAETGWAVILVHHSGKDESMGPRGHSALHGAVDTEIKIVYKKKGAAEERSMYVTKSREDEANITRKFNLRTVKVGENKYGDDIRTCQIVDERDEDFDITEITDKANLGYFPRVVKFVTEHITDNYGRIPDNEYEILFYNLLHEVESRTEGKADNLTDNMSITGEVQWPVIEKKPTMKVSRARNKLVTLFGWKKVGEKQWYTD